MNDPVGHADWLFDQVSGNLRNRRAPGTWSRLDSRATKAELRDGLTDAVGAYRELLRELAEADAAFDRLHRWIMAGEPLPHPWAKQYTPVFSETESDA